MGAGYLAYYQYLRSGLLLRHKVEGAGSAEIDTELEFGAYTGFT